MSDEFKVYVIYKDALKIISKEDIIKIEEMLEER